MKDDVVSPYPENLRVFHFDDTARRMLESRQVQPRSQQGMTGPRSRGRFTEALMISCGDQPLIDYVST